MKTAILAIPFILLLQICTGVAAALYDPADASPSSTSPVPDNVRLANTICMGSKGDAFGLFPITATMQLARITFHATGGGGVSCASSTTPSSCRFCCGSDYSIGFVVISADDVQRNAMDPSGTFVILANLPRLAKTVGKMIAWSQQPPLNGSSALFRALVGVEVTKGSYIAAVYLPDFFDYPDESLNSDTSACGFVTGLRFVHVVPQPGSAGGGFVRGLSGTIFAPQPELLEAGLEISQGTRQPSLPDYAGWMSLQFGNGTRRTWWVSSPASYDIRMDAVLNSTAAASGGLVGATVVYSTSSFPSLALSNTLVVTMVPISSAAASSLLTSGDGDAICAAAFGSATARGSIASVPSLLPAPLQASQSSRLYNRSDNSWLHDFMSSVAPQFSVVYSSPINGSLIRNAGGAGGAGGTAVLCSTSNLASDLRDVLVQQVLLTDVTCTALSSDDQRCKSNPFCRAVDPSAAAGSQVPCCWNGQADTAFFNNSQSRLFPSCTCGLSGTGLTPAMQYLLQPNCSMQKAAATSQLTISLTTSLICSSTAYASQGVSYAACVTQFVKCPAGPYDTIGLINRAFAQTGSGIISGFSCPVVRVSTSPPPPPPTSARPATQSPFSVANYSIAVSLDRTTFSIGDVVAGKAALTMNANLPWNVTAVLLGLPSAFQNDFPTFRRFEFSFGAVFTNYTLGTRLLGPYSIEIQLGPCPLFDPTSTETISITVPSTWLIGAPASSSSLSVINELMFDVVVDDALANAKKRVTFILSASIAIGALATGSSGLVGLTALQSQILSVTSHCAEPWTASYFQSTRQYFILLPSLMLENDVFTFGFTAGLLAVILAFHSLVALVHFQFFASTGSWRHSANVLFFPSPYLFGSMMFWVCITLSSFGGIINGSVPYQRMLVGLGWLVTVVMLGGIWYDGLRSGYDGYFKLYDQNDQRLLSSRFRWFRHFGRFERLFLPTGSWVQIRGYGVIRSNCHGQGCRFVLFHLILIALNAAHSASFASDADSYCDSFFYVFAAIGILNLAIFASIQPFRIPLLNMIWFGARVTEITQNILLGYWHGNATTPSNPTSLSIQLCASVLLGANAAFVGYSLLVTIFEYSLRSEEIIGNVVLIENTIASGIQAVVNVATFSTQKKKRAVVGRMKKQGNNDDDHHESDGDDDNEFDPFEDPELGDMMKELDDLYGPVAKQRTQNFGTGFSENGVARGEGRHSGERRRQVTLEEEEEEDAEEMRKRMRRAVLAIQPVPGGVTDLELKLLISVWSTDVTDIKRVGNAAFVGMLNAKVAHNVCSAFNGRLLFGTVVESHVIEDAFQL